MNIRCIALKLFLDALGVKPDISTIEQRKTIQKAVYLGQQVGLHLGYQFGWYLMGPYSPSLTDDYYALAESLTSGDVSYQVHKLQSAAEVSLRKARPLLQVPRGVDLSQENWLELVSSLHYLRKSAGLQHDATLETLKVLKPHLVQHTKTAEDILKQTGLLP